MNEILDTLNKHPIETVISAFFLFVLGYLLNLVKPLVLSGISRGQNQDKIREAEIKTQTSVEREELRLELARVQSTAKLEEQRLEVMAKQSEASIAIAERLADLTHETRGMNRANETLVSTVNALIQQFGDFIETMKARDSAIEQSQRFQQESYNKLADTITQYTSAITTQNEQSQKRHEEALAQAQTEYNNSVNILRTNELVFAEVVKNTNQVLDLLRQMFEVVNSSAFSLTARAEMIYNTVEPLIKPIYLKLGIALERERREREGD